MDDLQKARVIINDIDEKMLKLFVERMNTVKNIAKFKKEKGIAIFDPKREQEVISKNSELVKNEKIRKHYILFLENLMDLSRRYQAELNACDADN